MNRQKCYSVLFFGFVFLMAGLVLGCNSPPAVQYGPSSFNFKFEVEGATPPDQYLTISNIGGGSLNWTVSFNAQWLSLDPSNGSSTGEVDTVKVSVDVFNMDIDNYIDEISITTSGDIDSTQTIPVTLNVTSNWHEESLIVDCTLGQWCEKYIQFTMEENQEIHLLWSAYGDHPFIAVFLERPDGTCDAGYAGTHGGSIDSYTPTKDCHFFREPYAPYPLDLGKSGILNFYCSTTYDEHSKARIYPPGQYRLNFDVVAESPYYKGKEGDPIQTIIKVKYRIE